jgi:PAS domain S-box-containing protein
MNILYKDILILTSLTGLFTAFYVKFFRKKVSSTDTGVLLILVGVVWSLGYSLEIGSTQLHIKYFWSLIKSTGIILISMFFFLYVIHFMELQQFNNKIKMLLLFPVLVAIPLLFTNHMHWLIWSNVSLNYENLFTPLSVEYRLGFWFITIYNYIILHISVYLFIKMFRYSKQLYSFRASALLFCLVISWFSHFTYLLGWSPFSLDLTPVIVNITTITLAWIDPEKLYRRDIIPASRETILDTINDAAILLDPKDNILDCNRAARAICDYPEEIIGLNLSYVWPQLLEYVKANESNVEEIKLEVNSEKHVYHLHVSSLREWQGKIISKTVVLTDITDLKRYAEHLEELVEIRTQQLKQAERMATIGETAAMVGHDLRNPLQVILGNIELFTMKVDRIFKEDSAEKRDTLKFLEKVKAQSSYMNKIVSNLQDYARNINLDLKYVNLEQLVKGVLGEVNIPNSIRVSLLFDEDFPDLMVDATLMKRVFINLLLNAIQAMPDGGQLMIKADSSDGYAFLKITDSGIGIKEENIDQIFNPLFTTKAKGTGLGLAVCKKIILAHGGNITVSSEEGVGSTFTVKLLDSKIESETDMCTNVHIL